jgi:Lon protease-like protein
MTGDSSDIDASVALEAMPLFPLPGVVLFPRAILPLHIFEERYRAMTADALAGQRQIAMALLSPGWESNYQARPAVEPVVCVGTIISHERLPDGRFNLLLRGDMRCRIAREYADATHGQRLYRLARLQPIVESSTLEIDLSHERNRLFALLSDPRWAGIPPTAQIRALFRTAMRTVDIADLIAFHLLEDVHFKQELLADGDVRRRVSRLISSLTPVDAPVADGSVYDVPLADPTMN